MGNDEVTGTVDEKDANVLNIKGEGDVVTRYVKEADLLTVKGSRDELQTKLTAAEEAKAEKSPETIEAEAKADEAKNAQIKAEAKVESLTEEISKHTGTADELEKLKIQLVTAQEAGKSSATALLDLRRTYMITTYKVPPDTVNEKDLSQLEVFEEALKAVIGAAGGNYAFGGGSGGANALEGKSLHELGQMAYAETKK